MMARKKWEGAVAALFILAGLGVGGGSKDDQPVITDPVVNTCEHKRFLLVVSSLDGTITALNGQTGDVQWSLMTGTGPLLSSTISDIQYKRNDVPFRLIPSLDGGLYQMDGDGIEPIPLGADTLLSSTFRLTDDWMIVGGKEIESYGIDLSSGKVRYVCSASGCRYFDPSSFEKDIMDDVLVIKRSDRTVRAVEMNNGQEKWNFSVGQHEVTLSTTSRMRASFDSLLTESEMPEANFDTVEIDDKHEHVWTTVDEFDPYDVDMKVRQSNGLVHAVSRSSPGKIYWEHKFDTAIAATWMIRGNELSEISLFDDKNVLTLESDVGNQSPEFGPRLVYIGQYNDQMYVQPSSLMIREVEAATDEAVRRGDLVEVQMPRVVWRPYVATAPSRTPAVTNQRQIEFENDSDHGSKDTDKSLAVISREQYPFGEICSFVSNNGYYLYLDYTPAQPFKQSLDSSKKTGDQEQDMYFTGSLLQWWKEVTFISLLSSAVLHFILVKYIYKKDASTETRSPSPYPLQQPSEFLAQTEIKIADNMTNAGDLDTKTAEFISRYLMDFEQNVCLGHGGFGVVFKARNRLDDCEYAIKRIALHDSDRAQQKVMREVKALAKLDHPGIVRYYQSWFESPPPGWQEERDRTTIIDMSSIATPSPEFGLSEISKSAGDFKPSIKITNFDKQSFNPLRLDSLPEPVASLKSSVDGSSWSEGSESRSGIASGDVDSTEDGSVHESDTENKSFRGANNADDSFDISFRNGDSVDNIGADKSSSASCLRKRFNEKEDDSSFDVVFEKNSGKSSEQSLRNDAQSFRNETKDCDLTPSEPAIRPKALDLRPSGSHHSSDDAKAAPVKKLYLYIQMQLCRQDSLKEWLNNSQTQQVEKQVMFDIFHQIVSAIGYVHGTGLMHRDLKPSNIFFAMDGSVKIGDFGLVTAVEENCEDDGYNLQAIQSSRHTNQVGTKLYMSPEQTIRQTYTHKVDIYALGMIFFEMFNPFPTQMERVKTLMNVRKLVFPDRFEKDLKQEFEFVKPLLSHDPVKRPDAKDILCHPLLAHFEEASQAYHRLHSQSRNRSVSQSSSHSQSSSTHSNVAAGDS